VARDWRIVWLVAVLTTIAWIVATMAPLFFALKWVNILRVSEEDEERGLDEALHGGPAYITWEGSVDQRLGTPQPQNKVAPGVADAGSLLA
jgi:hypothetical protein